MFTTKLKYVKCDDIDVGRLRQFDDESRPQIMLTRKRTTERPIVLPRKLDVIPIDSISQRFLFLQRATSHVYDIRNSFGVNVGKRKGFHNFYIHMYTELNVPMTDFDFEPDEFFD